MQGASASAGALFCYRGPVSRYVLRMVLVSEDRHPLILEYPQACREHLHRALRFASINAARLQLSNDLLLSSHQAPPAGYVAAN